jgi:hypothetical protein
MMASSMVSLEQFGFTFVGVFLQCLCAFQKWDRSAAPHIGQVEGVVVVRFGASADVLVYNYVHRRAGRFGL